MVLGWGFWGLWIYSGERLVFWEEVVSWWVLQSLWRLSFSGFGKGRSMSEPKIYSKSGVRLTTYNLYISKIYLPIEKSGLR